MKIFRLSLLAVFVYLNCMDDDLILGPFKNTPSSKLSSDNIDTVVSLSMLFTNHCWEAKRILSKLLFNRGLTKDEQALLKIYKLDPKKLKKREMNAFMLLDNGAKMDLFRRCRQSRL